MKRKFLICSLVVTGMLITASVAEILRNLTALAGASMDSANDRVLINDDSANTDKSATLDELKIGLGLGTAASPQFTGIELSHASQNTLAGSGGDITVEGNRLFRVGGADVPVADGGTGLSSGTSGGVLAFTAAGTISSSGALAANAIVIGGGAGAAPSTTTTGTGVLTALGVNTGSAGAIVLFNGALGTPSSGVGTALTALNGENLQDDTVDDDSLDFGTGADQISAVDIPIADAGNDFTATEVEGALDEHQTDIEALQTSKANANKGGIGFNVSGDDAATGKVDGFVRVPYAGTITGWSIMVDAGTCTVKVWKVASGTAVPTIANVINTDGVAISANTAIVSTTLTDFTTTTVTANDLFAFDITAESGAGEISFQLDILAN